MAEQQQQIQIRVPESELKGAYANMMSLNTTKEEFIFDFAAINPAQMQGIVVSRIFMSPAHVKRMIEVVGRVMTEYEKNHGTVSVPETKEIGFTTS